MSSTAHQTGNTFTFVRYSTLVAMCRMHEHVNLGYQNLRLNLQTKLSRRLITGFLLYIYILS